MSFPTEATRVCIIGDETITGIGDPRGLGWVGRVAARTPSDPPVALFTLPAPAETTLELSKRWEDECALRFAYGTGSNRLVIALGKQDLLSGTSLARSRLNLANIVDNALNRKIPCFIVGPSPAEPEYDQGLSELSDGYRDVAERRGIPFVDLFHPLVNHEQWQQDFDSRYALPGQAGYGLIAWLVLHAGWHDWLGVAA